jgi:hypothetical protein
MPCRHEPKRSNQRNCAKCHRQVQKVFQERKKKKHEALIQALIDALIYARSADGDCEYWYLLAVAALKDVGYDEYGNKLGTTRTDAK